MSPLDRDRGADTRSPLGPRRRGFMLFGNWDMMASVLDLKDEVYIKEIYSVASRPTLSPAVL